MEKLEKFIEFEENNLASVIGGQITWRETQMANGGEDEDQLCHNSKGTFFDGIYDCEKGEWLMGGNMMP